MEENRLIIYKLLHKYVKDTHIEDAVAKELRKTNSMWHRFFNSFNDKFEGYSRFFDTAFFWCETSQGYAFWAYHQLRFYYCLWKARLVKDIFKLKVFRDRLYNANDYGEDEYIRLIKLVDKELFRNGKKQR